MLNRERFCCTLHSYYNTYHHTYLQVTVLIIPEERNHTSIKTVVLWGYFAYLHGDCFFSVTDKAMKRLTLPHLFERHLIDSLINFFVVCRIGFITLPHLFERHLID